MGGLILEDFINRLIHYISKFRLCEVKTGGGLIVEVGLLSREGNLLS